MLSLKRSFGPAAEVKGLRTYANNDGPDQPTHSGQDIRCLPAQYRELLEDIRIIAKILTRRVATQTGLGLRHWYLH